MAVRLTHCIPILGQGSAVHYSRHLATVTYCSDMQVNGEVKWQEGRKEGMGQAGLMYI